MHACRSTLEDPTYWLTSLIFGAAAFVHGSWAWPLQRIEYRSRWLTRSTTHLLTSLVLIALFATIAYLLILLTTSLAARLTAWEAAYRGLRLPIAVVQRALHYHSAHYLPVAFLAFATITSFQILLTSGSYFAFQHAFYYLYTLCGEVIVGAVYLFATYWTAMKSMMFANSAASGIGG